MKLLAVVGALASVGVLVAAGGNGRHLSAPIRQQIARVARNTAHSLGDSAALKLARVYGPVSYRAAVQAADGATTANRKKGRFDVLVLRGSFVCSWCPRPPGAASPHGSIVTRIWSPTGHGGGFGIRRKLPASFARLGKPTRIDLG